jgi:hypothetical protein
MYSVISARSILQNLLLRRSTHVVHSNAWQERGWNNVGVSFRPLSPSGLVHVGDVRICKGARMKLSPGWRADKTRKNRARATRKAKVRWEVLGLPGPIDTSVATSMADIRQQVSNLASCGFGQGTRSRSAEREAKTPKRAPDASGKRRREVAELPHPRGNRTKNGSD